jgi:hypothetical protein
MSVQPVALLVSIDRLLVYSVDSILDPNCLTCYDLLSSTIPSIIYPLDPTSRPAQRKYGGPPPEHVSPVMYTKHTKYDVHKAHKV